MYFIICVTNVAEYIYVSCDFYGVVNSSILCVSVVRHTHQKCTWLSVLVSN